MQLKSLILILLFSSAASAEIISVRDGLKSYRIEYSEKGVHFYSEGMDLSLKRRDCNGDIVSKAIGSLEGAYLRMAKQKQFQENYLVIKKREVTSFQSPNTPQGMYFRNLPLEMKRLKIEEALTCKE